MPHVAHTLAHRSGERDVSVDEFTAVPPEQIFYVRRYDRADALHSVKFYRLYTTDSRNLVARNKHATHQELWTRYQWAESRWSPIALTKEQKTTYQTQQRAFDLAQTKFDAFEARLSSASGFLTLAPKTILGSPCESHFINHNAVEFYQPRKGNMGIVLRRGGMTLQVDYTVDACAQDAVLFDDFIDALIRKGHKPRIRKASLFEEEWVKKFTTAKAPKEPSYSYACDFQRAEEIVSRMQVVEVSARQPSSEASENLMKRLLTSAHHPASTVG